MPALLALPQSATDFQSPSNSSTDSTPGYVADAHYLETKLESYFKTLMSRIQSLETFVRSNTPQTPNSPLSPALLATKPGPSEISASVPANQDDKEVTKTNGEITISESENPMDVEVANIILDIVENYGIHQKTDPSQPCRAKDTFFPTVLQHVKKGIAVRMVLPAFPFKSPNREGKVLGASPDLGEEIALANLQSFCDSIKGVYEHGAEIFITSDGIVYNDLLSVADEDVWTYGEKLREIAHEKKFANIKFLRLADLLEVAHSKSGAIGHASVRRNPEEDRIYYIAHAACFRRELVARYEPAGYDAKRAIKDDNDTCLTYRGYLRFLKKDLQHMTELKLDQDGTPLSAKKYDKLISGIAQRMISRGAAFAAAIRDTHGDYVRLSIHPTEAVTKFPVQLIPQNGGVFGQTPWHSSIAVGLDGSFTTGPKDQFANTHDLVYHNGQPYYFREKSDMFDWGDLKVDFEHLYPCGLIIRPAEGSPSARIVPMSKVKQLSINMSPVVLRGFSETLDEAVYKNKAHEAGEILPWTFGIIQKVKDAGVNTKLGNNVTSNEGMPMHFDGMFKFEEREDAVTQEVVKVNIPPGFQFFTALATAPEGTGYTLFASSRLFFQYLESRYTAERFEKIRWNMDNDGFWNAKLKDLPLIVRHPVTNEPCLRWHEPWDETKTKFSTCKVTLSNDDEEIVDVVTKLLYDFRVCLRFTWNVGDWLISDNTSMLHTRTAYTSGCERELWRIHFD